MEEKAERAQSAGTAHFGTTGKCQSKAESQDVNPLSVFINTVSPHPMATVFSLR